MILVAVVVAAARVRGEMEQKLVGVSVIAEGD